MYPYPQGGGGTQALCVLAVLLLIGAVVAGIFFGGSELLSPSIHAAKVDKLEAEASALRAQTAYEEHQREIAMNLAEQKAAADLQALQARRAKQLELMEPIATVGIVVGSVVALILAIAGSYYLVIKARAMTAGQVSASRQPVYHGTQLPSSPGRGQGGASEASTTPCPIQRAKIKPNEVTYDGFLAYAHDYILHPNRTRVYYRTGIVPEIGDIYLAILTEKQIVTWETNGHSGWVLPTAIKSVEDIRRCISRRDLYTLAGSSHMPGAGESPLFQSTEYQQEPFPMFWSSWKTDNRGHTRDAQRSNSAAGQNVSVPACAQL